MMIFNVFTAFVLPLLFAKSYADEKCFQPFCIPEDYQRSKPPGDPLQVKVAPFLREIFEVSDNDFSITFEVKLVFSWTDDRIAFNKTYENRNWEVDQELLNHVWVPKFDIRHMDENFKDTKGVFKINVENNVVKAVAMRVNIKPTITCKMRFIWYPFDNQSCFFVIQSLDSTHDVKFVTVKHHDFLAPDYTENVLLDYDLEIKLLPEDKQSLSYDSEFDFIMKKLYERTGSPKWSNAGFQILLVRRWERYILIYYIPSTLCVFASWASFFISITKSLPARSGLLVTLFLTLTTLLASTIVSSPRVGSITALSAWIIIQYVFLIFAIAYLAFVLINFRHYKLGQKEFLDFEKKMDMRCLVVFVLVYLSVTGIYLGVIKYHFR